MVLWLFLFICLALEQSHAAAVGNGRSPQITDRGDRQYLHTLSWETFWMDSGQTEVEHMTVPLPYELVHQPHQIRHSPLRCKRIVYGADDRVRLDPATDGTRFPYTAVVSVSMGCSGMLVSPMHVLFVSARIALMQPYPARQDHLLPQMGLLQLVLKPWVFFPQPTLHEHHSDSHSILPLSCHAKVLGISYVFEEIQKNPVV